LEVPLICLRIRDNIRMPTQATIRRIVKDSTVTVRRSKTIFSASLRRTWAEMPPDARVSHGTIAQLAGVNVRTVQRHVQRGLLPNSSMIEKAKVEQWLKAVEGSLKPGRPSNVRFRNARQRVLPI